jgi:hypothetical protein
MKKLLKRTAISSAVTLLIAVMLLMTFTACSSEKSEDSDSGASSGYSTEPSYGDDYSSADEAAPASENYYALQNDVASEVAPLDVANAAGSQADNSSEPTRKITFSATYAISTKNYDKDYALIYSLVDKANGYIASENSYAPPSYDGRTEARSSMLGVRIPIGKFDSFMTELEGIGEVTNKTKSSEDLTSQYFDTESRIELLEMRKIRLMDYIKKAEKASDIVQFESELSDVLYELDQYQGEKRGLDRLVDYATIDIELNEQITPDTIGADGKPLGDRAGNALSMSVQNVKIFLGNTFVFLAGALPVILLIAVIGAIVWLIIRQVRNRRRKRRDAAAHKTETDQGQGQD